MISSRAGQSSRAGTRAFAAAVPSHGAAGVATVVMLVIFEMLIVGAIIAGTREQSLTPQRLDAARAFYAAEAGANMAIREFMAAAGVGDDEDGDTIIGSISNNGNAGDNPQVDTARFMVSRTGGPNPPFLITADASAGDTRSRITATINIDPASGRRVIYCQWSNQIPLYRIWHGNAWSAAKNTLDLGAKQYWSVIRRCPVRTEVIAVCSLQGSVLKAAVQKGLAWNDLVTATSDCGTINARPFYFAYEQNSGDGLLVYRKQNFSDIYYRTWNGTSWSSESAFTSPLSGKPLYMKLVPRRNSDEMMLCVSDDKYDIAALVWNGSSFTSAVTLETDFADPGPTIDNEAFDLAYEGSSGRCMVVWGQDGNTQPQYRIWDGSAWLSQASMPGLTNDPLWLRLASDRTSNKLLFGALDQSNDITLNTWSGAAWGANLQIEASAPTIGSRCFDLAFEPAGARGLVLWGRNSITPPLYRTYNGATWSAEALGPALLSTTLLVQLTPSRKGSEIMVLHNVTGGQNSLQFMRWDGSSLLNTEVLEGNVSGPAGAEVFMIPDDPADVIDPLRVWTWDRVAP